MTPSSQQAAQAGGRPRESPGAVLDRVERALRDMWKPPKPGEPLKSRACTMNLVVVAPRRDVVDRWTGIVDQTTQGVPARAILVSLEPNAAHEHLDGDATAVCWIADEREICSERVRLWAEGAMCGRIASAIDALCVPEMPTVIVWLGEVRPEDPLFRSLAGHAQRILLDTGSTSFADALRLAAWARAEPGRPALADLGWTRLAVWQEMCARLFDDPPLREHAHHVTRVRLVQASAEGDRLGAPATLLLGWLASRLDWRPVDGEAGVLRFQRPDGALAQVQLEAAPRVEGAEPYDLVSVMLGAEHAGVTMEGVLTRDICADDKDALVWRRRAGVPCPTEQRVRWRHDSPARLLERTLHRPVHDPALVETLAASEPIVALTPTTAPAIASRP